MLESDVEEYDMEYVEEVVEDCLSEIGYARSRRIIKNMRGTPQY